MIPRSPHLPSDDRRRATLLLVAFVWALLAGAFLHPLGAPAHVCGVESGHVDVDPEHGHDDGDCPLCHLAHELAHTAPLAPAATAIAAVPSAKAPRPAAAQAPPAPSLRAFFSRGPPARV